MEMYLDKKEKVIGLKSDISKISLENLHFTTDHVGLKTFYETTNRRRLEETQANLKEELHSENIKVFPSSDKVAGRILITSSADERKDAKEAKSKEVKGAETDCGDTLDETAWW